ncbi:MAP kinase kinase 10 [Actinidia rufa]|uniref:MAP kinase kinase 10 n=1 Tax=Actinidia rufa TaxID=165716 RepID=A0A7J0FQ79_9ERIC|nr:MAP kinase kinase 10 [Actinidia rufa]
MGLPGRRLVTWTGGVGMPCGSFSVDQSGAKTGLGDVNVCYLLWREDEDAGHGISGVLKFCVEMFGKGLEEERDSDRASYPPFCDKMV